MDARKGNGMQLIFICLCFGIGNCESTSFAPLVQIPPRIADDWTYNADVSVVGRPQTLWPGTEKPSDLSLEFETNDETLHISEFQYGNASSHRVALVVAVSADETTRFFIDKNRNRRIEDSELVIGEKGTWQHELEAEFVEDDLSDPQRLKRVVQWKWNPSGPMLTYRTVGCLRGDLNAKNDRWIARISDEDGNGRFGDSGDGLWIDFNADGKFNAFSERLVYSPIVNIGDDRFQLITGSLGSSFRIEPLVGLGTIAIALDDLESKIDAYQVLLIGRDGQAIPVSADRSNDPIPVGEYRIHSLYLRFVAEGKSESWNFRFSGMYRGDEATWYEVRRDQSTLIQPLGEVKLSLLLPEIPIHLGQPITATPRLSTSTGLMINNCWRGNDAQSWDQKSSVAKIDLFDSRMGLVDSSSSGFH